MKSRSKLQTFAFALCVLALCMTQVFGMRAGYLCVCAGEAVLTQTSHCHGPHGADCHSFGEETFGAHHEEDQGSREDHATLKTEPSLRSPDVTSPVIAPAALQAMVPLFKTFPTPSQALISHSGRGLETDSPPPGVKVAGTIVLLI
ncbi:MAG: hypothetical protein V4710_09225 [Verrucomicrobiota bacterium]